LIAKAESRIEAQWEYACRAGTTTPFAGNVDEMAWTEENSDEKAHPVYPADDRATSQNGNAVPQQSLGLSERSGGYPRNADFPDGPTL
jgi:formylglycine-generating enzyme required for sulfatase activity